MIDMGSVFVVLDRTIEMVHDLHGLDISDTEEGKEKSEVRSQKAEISRQLLEIADLFGLIESLVRNEYWVMKGRGMDAEMGEFRD